MAFPFTLQRAESSGRKVSTSCAPVMPRVTKNHQRAWIRNLGLCHPFPVDSVMPWDYMKDPNFL